LATHYIPSNIIPELEEAIINLGPAAGDTIRLQALLNDFQGRTALPPGQLPGIQADIDRIFDGRSSVEEIIDVCRRSGGKFGQDALVLMAK